MIKVLHVVGKMDRAGLETFIMNVYRNIDREQIQFDFLVHQEKQGDYDEEIKKMGGNIFYIPSRKKGIRKNKQALYNFYDEHPEYQVVHHHVSSLTYMTPLFVAQKKNIKKRIIHCHSTGISDKIIHLFFHLFNKYLRKMPANNYFACSNEAGSWAYKKKYINSNNFKVINNGIELSDFVYNKSKRLKKRNELGIKKEFVIGHVGRFAKVKNHNFIIDVFNEIVKINNNSKLILIGDGPLMKVVKEKVTDLNLSDNVLFLGVRSDVSDFLQVMDSFVFPSHYEGLGIALIEAQAAGLPCFVSSNIPKETKITDYIFYKDLKKSSKIWAKKIMAFNKNYIRNPVVDNSKLNFYDIINVSKELGKFYLE